MSEENKQTLLIVDDETDLREVLAELCLDLTPHIVTASNGKEALNLIRAGQITAVLSDISMPVMSGLQLLAEIRYMGLDTPFVVCTGYGDKKNAAEALRLGATEFLEKPVQENDLLTTMRFALDLGSAMAAVEREVELLCETIDAPADKVAHFKKLKRSILMMRKDFNTTIKKGA